jgi:integrase
MKLTAQSADELKIEAGKTDVIVFDDAVPGFGLRIRDTGSRSWVYQYKVAGKTRRLVIGQASAIKFGRAKEIASEYHAKVRLGRDPASERWMQIQRISHTLGALVARYLDQRRSELRPGSYREIARHLKVHAAPLHRLPADAVDQRAVAERLSTIEKNSGAVTANRVRSSLSAMFTWGMKEGLVLANPTANTNKREERPRDRVLTDAELRAIWLALGERQYGTIIKLLMLTGQRLNEIAGLRWTEIDFDRGVISLPGNRTKNGKPHELPMSAQVLALLAAQPEVSGRDLVFGKGRGPFSGFGRPKEALDEAIAQATGRPLAPWVVHDIRRSVATGMADIGIMPHVIEAVLNHVSGHKGGVAGIYNRASYAKEKAEALVRWDEHIRSIVEKRDSKVVGLPGRR